MAIAAHSLPLWPTELPPSTHSTTHFSYWAFPITWYTTQQKDHRYTIKIQICTILLKTLSHHLLPIPQPISPTGHFPSLGYSQTKDNIIIKTKVFCCGTLSHSPTAFYLPIPQPISTTGTSHHSITSLQMVYNPKKKESIN